MIQTFEDESEKLNQSTYEKVVELYLKDSMYDSKDLTYRLFLLLSPSRLGYLHYGRAKRDTTFSFEVRKMNDTHRNKNMIKQNKYKFHIHLK